MAAIKIRVGASLDRSVDVVFQDIAKRSKRTADIVQRNMAGTGRGGPYRAAARAAQDSYDRQGRAAEVSARRQARAIEMASRQQARAFAQAARVAEREQQRVTRNMARGFKQFADIAGREMVRAQRSQERSGISFARRTSHRATRFLAPNAPLASWGRRAAGDLLRGAGVDFSLGNSVARSRDMETRAVSLSNAGYIRGAGGPAGLRQDPAALVAEARRVGDIARVDPGAALEGVQQYVGKTGDLATGRALLEDMARLSKATGADMNEMVAAAGDVGQAFGDAATTQEEAEQRAKSIAAVMRVIAGQGKLGAVEVKDLASQMAKVSTSATAFAGDRGQNIATMGALAQMARSRGGAASANIAATSVASFVNTLRTPARAEAFRSAGVQIEAGGGKFRDPQEIIIDAIKAAGEDTAKFKGMFANVQGARAVEGFRQTYLEAGGGAKGEEAVRAKFKELGAGAAIREDEELESFNRALATTGSKAQKFQNELDRVAEEMAGRVLPELEKAGPAAIELAKALGSVASWVVENPKKTIGAAIMLSIGRAGIESVLRAGIERMILGPNGGGVGGAAGGRAAAVGGLANNLGAGLAITAAAVTITALGMVAIDRIADVGVDKQRKDVSTDLQITNLQNHVRTGAMSTEQVKEAEALASGLRARIAAAKQNVGTSWGDTMLKGASLPFRAAKDWMGGKSASVIAESVADTGNLNRLEDQLAEIERTMSGVKDGTLKVQIVNVEDLRPIGVDGSNRQPPPGGFRVDQNPR